jgi:MioC protein
VETHSSPCALFDRLFERQGVRFAGNIDIGCDTFYEETYSQGSEVLDRPLTELGAVRVGDYGRHDASSWDLGSDVALEWLPGVALEADDTRVPASAAMGRLD